MTKMTTLILMIDWKATKSSSWNLTKIIQGISTSWNSNA